MTNKLTSRMTDAPYAVADLLDVFFMTCGYAVIAVVPLLVLGGLVWLLVGVCQAGMLWLVPFAILGVLYGVTLVIDSLRMLRFLLGL